MIHTLTVDTGAREEMVDVTRDVARVVADSGYKDGLVFCFVPHTTAAITINENADPDVTRDILHKLRKEIPQQEEYHHSEGNSDAHVKATLIGAAEQILFEGGRLVLGRWQGIYFCEFDGPRQRRLLLRVVSFA